MEFRFLGDVWNIKSMDTDFTCKYNFMNKIIFHMYKKVRYLNNVNYFVKMDILNRKNYVFNLVLVSLILCAYTYL